MSRRPPLCRACRAAGLLRLAAKAGYCWLCLEREKPTLYAREWTAACRAMGEISLSYYDTVKE